MPETIMIVDDEPDTIDLTRKILSKEGHQIIEAISGTECLEILKNEKPDLILLDVMVPNENGWEICKKIKTNDETKDIPVVMFTALLTEDAVKKSLEHADAWINKPFKAKKLRKLVNSFTNG